MDRDDVRVPQPGDLAGLDAALVDFATGHGPPVDPRNLHGHPTLEPGVERAVNSPETALAYQNVETIPVGQESGEVGIGREVLDLPWRPNCGLDRAIEPGDLAELLERSFPAIEKEVDHGP